MNTIDVIWLAYIHTTIIAFLLLIGAFLSRIGRRGTGGIFLQCLSHTMVDFFGFSLTTTSFSGCIETHSILSGYLSMYEHNT